MGQVRRRRALRFRLANECAGRTSKGQALMCLCYAAPSTSRLQRSTLAPIVHSEEAMAAWLKYVEAVVTRYKKVVNEWEIWNEPFGQGKDYAIMVLATAELIKRIQPDAVVLVTAITDADRVDVLEALKTANRLDLVDYWVYHPYARNPDTSYAWVEKQERLSPIVPSTNCTRARSAARRFWSGPTRWRSIRGPSTARQNGICAAWPAIGSAVFRRASSRSST